MGSIRVDGDEASRMYRNSRKIDFLSDLSPRDLENSNALLGSKVQKDSSSNSTCKQAGITLAPQLPS
jgi:hypothetical protein